MHYPHLPCDARRQSGAALLISLIILIALTILGVAALSNSRLQSRIAANQEQMDLSFQAGDMAMNSFLDLADSYTSDSAKNPLQWLYGVGLGTAVTRCLKVGSDGVVDKDSPMAASCSDMRSSTTDTLTLKARVQSWVGYWNTETKSREVCAPVFACPGISIQQLGSASDCHVFEVRSDGWIEAEAGEETDEPEAGDIQTQIRSWPLTAGPAC